MITEGWQPLLPPALVQIQSFIGCGGHMDPLSEPLITPYPPGQTAGLEICGHSKGHDREARFGDKSAL